MGIFLVVIGGFIGAICRYYISSFVNGKLFANLPFGTFFVNIMGSFLLGILYGIETESLLLLFLGTGFMGAFTTFSTFMNELLVLMNDKQSRFGYLYLIISLVFGIFSVYCGYVTGQLF